MQFQTCSRHPQAGRFLTTCSGCAQELHDIQYGTPKPDPVTAAKARTALGLSRHMKVRTELGETATRILVWSVRELAEIADRHRGRVTRREVTRDLHDGTSFDTVEVTLSVRHPDFANPIQVFTDWDPETDGPELAFMRPAAGRARVAA